MKVEIHSTFMDNLMTPFFYDSIKEFATKFNKENPEAKKLQFYSDFFLPNACILRRPTAAGAVTNGRRAI